MQDSAGGDNFKTPAIFQQPDNLSFVGGIGTSDNEKHTNKPCTSENKAYIDSRLFKEFIWIDSSFILI